MLRYAHMRSRGAIEGLLVVLAATALTVVLTFPVALHFDRIGRINTDDGRWSIWVVAWVAHALTSDPAQLYQANIFYPHRNTLAFSEANIGAGLMAAPVWLLTKNAYAAHNFAFFMAFVLAFSGAYYLTRYLTGDRAAAAVAATLFAFCPYMYARTAHIQLLFIGLIPFCMLAFHRLVDRPTAGRAAALGVLISFTALTCAYYGIFAALMIGLGTFVYATSRRQWRSGEYWVGIALAAFTAIGVTLPFFLPYLQVQGEGGFVRTLDDARQYSANLQAWGASAAWAHRWWLPAIAGYNEVLFPGIITLLLGAVGMWAMRRVPDTLTLYLLIAVFAFWSSFGPDAGLYRVFYETIPIFSFLRAPSRMGIMVTLSLVVFAAAGMRLLLAQVSRRIAVAAAVSVIAALELTAAPLNQFRVAEPFPPAYRILATLPPGAVAEFPYWYERHDFPRHAYYMLNSTTHWKPLINGYSDHIPADFRQSVLSLSSFPSRESFAILARAGARYVVFHLDMYNTRLRERLFERLHTYSPYLRPIVREGDVWLFEIVDWPN
jgi:hypothetical protein